MKNNECSTVLEQPCPTHNLAVTNYTAKVEIDGKIQMVDGYATSDLLERHPTKENMWKMYALSFMVVLLI
jgi:hypothetical protein